VVAAGGRAQTRFCEFFILNIRNPHTRRAYARAVQEFLAWCEQHGLASIIDVETLHVGTYIEAVTPAEVLSFLGYLATSYDAAGFPARRNGAPRSGIRCVLAKTRWRWMLNAL
jgi:hypothetical protein